MPLNKPTLPPSAISTPRAKITPSDRNAIYALRHVLHVSPQVLSDAFGISCVTVHQIASHKTKTYKDVLATVKDIGVEAMYDRYVTQEILDKIGAISYQDSPPKAQALHDAELAARGAPNRNADKHIGTHKIPVDYPEGSTCTIEISWTDPGYDRGEGWWIREVNGSVWGRWFGDDTGRAFATSTTALKWAKAQIWMPNNGAETYPYAE